MRYQDRLERYGKPDPGCDPLFEAHARAAGRLCLTHGISLCIIELTSARTDNAALPLRCT